jgi:hypothetical protein
MYPNHLVCEKWLYTGYLMDFFGVLIDELPTYHPKKDIYYWENASQDILTNMNRWYTIC